MSTLPTIALLGGGQLGRMFIENALRYPVHVAVIDPDPEAPCSPIASEFRTGDLLDEHAIVEHARNADVIGIEIDFHRLRRAIQRLPRIRRHRLSFSQRSAFA